MPDFKRYENIVTGEIVSYPEDAAALFPALKLVPSERAKSETEAEAPVDKDSKNAK